MANFVNFTKVVFNVVFTEQRDVEPEVFTEAALNALA